MKTRVLDSWAILEWIKGRDPARKHVSEMLSAASLKGQYPISYADAFAAGLALKYNCPLVTGDKEFRSVPHLEVEWLGKP